jgi:DNA modification methylase/transcription elongation factor Elf1
MFETEKDQKITVLGKTFNSEEERRAYFREELRMHLPELKKMEGFPIGKDEDILNLSDPPYYTACPNPWLNDFIAEWEEEKKQLEKEGKRDSGFEVDEPYAADVSEGKNHPIYSAHTYFTKVPHAAIMRYILHYTDPGDIIFDGFCGTGMAGVAADFCSDPTSAESIRIKQTSPKAINFGKRQAICSDISPFGTFVASNYNKKINLLAVREEYEKIKHKLLQEYPNIYGVTENDKNIGETEYVVWSQVFSCPSCNNEIGFLTDCYDNTIGKVKSNFECSNCGRSLVKKELDIVEESVFDPIIDKVIKSNKYVPALISYKSGKKRLEKLITSQDKTQFEAHKELINIPFLRNYSYPMMNKGGKNWADIYRSGYHNGITHSHQFFTNRNFFIFYYLWNNSKSNELKWVLSSVINYINKKQSYSGGGGGMPGVHYIASLYQEKNVFTTVERKIKNLAKVVNAYKNDDLGVVSCNPAQDTTISSDSIDYIFVDPPFGANIMYSEASFLWESSLHVFTENKKEAIKNRSQNKGLFEYNSLMHQSFQECFRILKPGKWMTVEFSNTGADIWNGIQNSIQNSGFIIANVSALDKKQGGFKGVTTPTAVQQDLVISCYKPSSTFDKKFQQNQNKDVAIWEFMEEHLNHLPVHLTSGSSTTAIIERSPKILFDRLIAYYVQKGLPVPIDAGVFQNGLRDRFIERDGMFFTNEQVQEYDKKKAENPEFIQLSILVSSEQDGVLWLKNLLTDKSLTYQDIQPIWMQALAGVRKGDVIPELADILEENFLKDVEGKWYTPDPENEADLEKLRTKRLLKQFDTYKTEAAKPKAKKIKEVRVEALRAGFKQCYQDKDFASIVAVGDKIPNNLLMEDEVLLQFYDIASSRV